MRGRIAGGLLTLVGVLSLASAGLIFIGHSLDDIAKLYGILVRPLIAMASGVVGFYFGAESQK